MNFQEKRKNQRLIFKAAANCQINDRLYSGYVLDISPGGMKLELSGKPEVGAKAIVVVELDPPLKVAGTIKWNKREKLHYVCGIEFGDLTEEQSAQVSELIQSLFWSNFGG